MQHFLEHIKRWIVTERQWSFLQTTAMSIAMIFDGVARLLSLGHICPRTETDLLIYFSIKRAMKVAEEASRKAELAVKVNPVFREP